MYTTAKRGREEDVWKQQVTAASCVIRLEVANPAAPCEETLNKTVIDQHRAKSNTDLCLVRHILYRLYCIRRKPHFLKKERLLKNALLEKHLFKKYILQRLRISGLCKGAAITTQNSGS